jgi:septum site-determining protein MinC
MEATNAVAETIPALSLGDDAPPPAILRGTARGLEIVIDGSASTTAITAAVMKRLDEAPAFFRGSDVRIRVEDMPLAPGCLARLDEIAVMFELRIVEVTAVKRSVPVAVESDAVPQANLATGSMPSPAVEQPAAPPPAPEIAAPAPSLTESAPIAVAEVLETPGTRIVVGPVRSGVILDHAGHLVVFGDINPGAEVRATGNIVVLGRLRGTAHAGIGGEVGFILALRLEPQQLRICRQVARAADSDTPGTEPEIAYATGGSIVVERYQGKLPGKLATSI